MYGLSIWHLIIVVTCVVLLFSRGLFVKAMGDLARGIRLFRTHSRDEPEAGEREEPNPTRPGDA